MKIFITFGKSYYTYLQKCSNSLPRRTQRVKHKLHCASNKLRTKKDDVIFMINSELLKEAIADAKAVRATALANAKAALEEAFAPRFEAMFAEKLREESEEQEETVAEVEAPNQVSGKDGEAKGPKTKSVSKGQPKKVSDADSNFKAVRAGQGPTDVPEADDKIDEAAEEEEEGKKVDEVAEEEQEEAKKTDESVNEFGLTSEDLDEIIKELEAEVASEEDGEKNNPAAKTPPAPETPAPEDEPADELSPAPEAPAPEGEPAPEGSGDEVDIDVAAPKAGTEVPSPVDDVPNDKDSSVSPAPEEDDDENINLEELLAALNEESEEEEEEEEGKKMDETAEYGCSNKDLKGQDKSGGVKGYPFAPQDASTASVTGNNHNIQGKGNIGTGEAGGKPKLEETAQYKQALEEAYKTIEFLRGQINEVNLLNAKLLYTNKLFKEFADILDDQYRLKIVESFDLTKSVREVKLAYALLAESLSFGTQVAKTKAVKPATKPAITTKASVKQITEGLASKPVASTKPAQLIAENVNEMALRFKKLAGIKETPKASEKK